MKPLLHPTTLLMIVSTSLLATNGDHLIGLGAKARGMGGVGIAISHGAESALSNPAMITALKSTEFSFGGTIFMPDVQTNNVTSKADMSVIPEVSMGTSFGNGVYSGIGMWGTAGMGVDYRDTGSNMNMVTNLQLMQFGIPLAYKTGNLSLGITPILQYGSLDMNYDGATTKGAAQDLAFGYNVGAAYSINDITLGAVYKSPIKMTYKGQVSESGLGFSDDVEQPEEIGMGVAYKIGDSVVGVDYKRINWASAIGYRDFGWQDQDVYAIGYEYKQNNWAARAGYNYAKNPIVENSNPMINFFNLTGFPATVESHYALGGSYVLNKKVSLDGAYVYAPETTEKLSGVTTKHSQQSLSLQVTFNY